MTPEEKYVIALVLASSAKAEAARESYVDISVEMALSHDWSAEDRMAMRDAAAMVLRTMHMEFDLLIAVQSAIQECLGTCGGSVY